MLALMFVFERGNQELAKFEFDEDGYEQE